MTDLILMTDPFLACMPAIFSLLVQLPAILKNNSPIVLGHFPYDPNYLLKESIYKYRCIEG